MNLYNFSTHDTLGLLFLLALVAIWVASLCSRRTRSGAKYWTFFIGLFVFGFSVISFMLNSIRSVIAALMGTDQEILILHWSRCYAALSAYAIFSSFFISVGFYFRQVRGNKPR